MERTVRDTSGWFDRDNKGSLMDKSIAKSIGPGMPSYSTQPSPRGIDQSYGSLLALTTKVSWNTGQVPFGVGSTRAQQLNTQYKQSPGVYEPDMQVITKPIARKGEQANTVLKSQLLRQQMSPQFKSKQNKISIYDAEEQRIKNLYGQRQSQEFKVKLNDQVLVASPHEHKVHGKIKTGTTVEPTDALIQTQFRIERLKETKDKAFSTDGKLKIGPGDYDSAYSLTKKRLKVACLDEITAGEQEKDKLEKLKTEKLWDGSGSTIKHIRPTLKLKLFEERFESPKFEVKPIEAVFKSKQKRFKVEQERAPAIGVYDPKIPSNQRLQGTSKAVFGSQTIRDQLILRDVSVSPHKNPTSLQSPAPDQYQTQNRQNSTFVSDQPNFGLIDIKDKNGSSVFQSSFNRDILQSVSIEAKTSPGPGSYIEQRNLTIQPSPNRLGNNPFGTSQARFEYERKKIEPQQFKEELSVPDEEIIQRRLALQKTAELHQKLNQFRPNQIFASTVQRKLFGFPDLVSEPDMVNKTKSTFGVGGDPGSTNGSSITFVEQVTRPGADRGYFVEKRDLQKPSFNSVMPRFATTQPIKTQETPGPGQYNTPISQDLFQTTSKLDKSSIFKDKTMKLESWNALHGNLKYQNKLGPGQYKVKQAFVAKTFNRSLPPAKFV